MRKKLILISILKYKWGAFMENKILLGNKKNFYKANMHCHSNLSDGKLTPEELKELYKGNGYSILAITDHDSIRNHSYLDDEDFLTITSMEVTIKERLVSANVDRHMKVCHLNLYALEQDNDYNVCYSTDYDYYSPKERQEEILKKNGGEYKREYSPEGINKIIDIANEKGFLVCYNHPQWSLENYLQYSKYDNLWAMEIFNTSSIKEGLFEYNQTVFDDFLRMGKRLFPIAADDNHNNPVRWDSCGGFIMVNSDNLQYNDVMQALKSGDFYASTGPTIEEVSVCGDEIKVKCSNAKFISMTTCGRRTDRKIANENEYVDEAQFKFIDDDIYFRISVVDEFGNRASTRAYFVKEI